MDSEEYRKKIEKELLDVIVEQLKSGHMSSERAREIAQYVLQALHPHMSLDEIYRVIPKLGDHFPELAKVVLPIVNEYEDKVKKVVTQQVQKLIQENKIEEANALLKKATSKKT